MESNIKWPLSTWTMMIGKDCYNVEEEIPKDTVVYYNRGNSDTTHWNSASAFVKQYFLVISML